MDAIVAGEKCRGRAGNMASYDKEGARSRADDKRSARGAESLPNTDEGKHIPFSAWRKGVFPLNVPECSSWEQFCSSGTPEEDVRKIATWKSWAYKRKGEEQRQQEDPECLAKEKG